MHKTQLRILHNYDISKSWQIICVERKKSFKSTYKRRCFKLGSYLIYHLTQKVFNDIVYLLYPANVQTLNMLILTAVIGQTWDHDPSADPVLQGQRSRQGGRLQVLRVGLRKLREAGVSKRRVLAPERGQGVHGGRIQAGNWGQSWMREVQNAGFGDYSCLKLRGPRRRGVRTAAGDRAARRAVAAEVSTPPVILICEQSIDSEVSWFLHRCLCRSKTNKKKTPENKPTWSFVAAHLCRASQRRSRSQTHAFPLSCYKGSGRSTQLVSL